LIQASQFIGKAFAIAEPSCAWRNWGGGHQVRTVLRLSRSSSR